MPSKATGPIAILNYGGYSDADPKHRPSGAQWQKCDPEWVRKVYLSKVAQKWMEDSRQAEAGKQYQLDKLPPGYEVWEKARNDKQLDRFCFGHPNHGQGFNSPYDFYPHFEFLMQYDGEDDVCKCRFCSKRGNSARKTTSRSSSKPAIAKPKSLGIRGRPPLKRGPVDDEGSPDVIVRLLSVLQQEGYIDRKVEERSNMDWRVETVVYKDAKELIQSQRSFVPRVGELVLFHRDVDGEVRRDPDASELKLWSSTSKRFAGHPEWLGGIITQVPIAAEPVLLKDINHETPKKHSVNSSGFRVECYPSPNTKDKDFSKQYSHVSLNRIRPMILCDDTLKDIAAENWHPTIQNVMTAMGTVSCVSRYKIKGDWPNFSMLCEAIYLGSEIIWAGEPLRLMPRGKEIAVIDVIVPDCFVVRVHGLQPEEDGTVTGNRANKIHLLVIGSVYTTDKSFSQGYPVEEGDEIPEILHAYGPWYHKATSKDKFETGFTHILGRLYEFEAMKQWFPTITTPEALDKGMASTRTSRAYATSHRKDHSGAHLGWFWGEDRASALDLATFNGIEVGAYDKEREPKKWREVLAVLDGTRDRVVEPVAEPSSQGGEGASGFIAVNHRKSSLVAPPITQEDSEAEDEAPGHAVNRVIDVDEYDGVIEGLISGEGFSAMADPNEAGSSSAAPAAKRARVV